jgi:hypothetical protein
MYRKLLSGQFGNIMRAWPSLDAVEQSGYRGFVSMRSMQRDNPIRLYHVPFAELRERVAALPPALKKHGLVFSESPPDECRIIQGELTINHCGYWFEHTYSPLPMRLAFDVQRSRATGLEAKLLLERYVSPPDLDDIKHLLEAYPDHVIEFSAFSIPIGVIPGRRACIWEVRQY